MFQTHFCSIPFSASRTWWKPTALAWTKTTRTTKKRRDKKLNKTNSFSRWPKNVILGIRKNWITGRSAKNSNRFYNYCTVITNAEQKFSKQVESIFKVLFRHLKCIFRWIKIKCFVSLINKMFISACSTLVTSSQALAVRWTLPPSRPTSSGRFRWYALS